MSSVFERGHHRRIAAVLDALDGDRLRQAQCWFGGGTAIALAHGEYRESVDIDLMVSDVAGYRCLRQMLAGRTSDAHPEGRSDVTDGDPRPSRGPIRHSGMARCRRCADQVRDRA
ncbi:nucleotidyl transferase AbiEii/AbiGii toxin family protein [Luteimonas sp. TWI662]|uniref:nucleotidyl transferase AbiEii/AbiGii toxin family protein n=1 Tax=Luteimonas sp. TWI662 TaxID=3136789 RepID=UPI003208F917